MPLARFSKRPLESYTRGLDMTGLLPEGRTISSCPITARRLSDNEDVTAAVLASASGAISGSIISYRVQGGDLNEEYDLLFSVNLDNGELLEEFVRMRVEAEPS